MEESKTIFTHIRTNERTHIDYLFHGVLRYFFSKSPSPPLHPPFPPPLKSSHFKQIKNDLVPHFLKNNVCTSLIIIQNN